MENEYGLHDYISTFWEESITFHKSMNLVGSICHLADHINKQLVSARNTLFNSLINL